MKQPYTQTATITAAILGLTSASLFGAGFQLAERSTSGLGRAFSGEAAIGDDASVLASNPAGMILLEDNSISVGLQYINPHVGAEGTSPFAAGQISDNDIATDAYVPYLYYTRKINDKLTVGVGMFASFGLATDYSTGFANRAGTETSEITTFTINPSIAYRINDAWTIGAGFDLLHVEGRLTSRNPFTQTRAIDIRGDDWGYGWNVGILHEMNDRTRFGLHYRSAIHVKVDGDATGTSVPGGKQDAVLRTDLPDTVELSAYHELNDQWAIHGDVIWTNWSRFHKIQPVVDGLPTNALRVNTDWEDSYRYALGTTYKHSDDLTFRMGIALDESPVSTSKRTLRIPDGDRLWLSIGATIKLNDCYNLDIAYTHIFADSNTIRSTGNGGNEDLFNGKVGGDVDIFGIGISGSF